MREGDPSRRRWRIRLVIMTAALATGYALCFAAWRSRYAIILEIHSSSYQATFLEDSPSARLSYRLFYPLIYCDARLLSRHGYCHRYLVGCADPFFDSESITEACHGMYMADYLDD